MCHEKEDNSYKCVTECVSNNGGIEAIVGIVISAS